MGQSTPLSGTSPFLPHTASSISPMQPLRGTGLGAGTDMENGRGIETMIGLIMTEGLLGLEKRAAAEGIIAGVKVEACSPGSSIPRFDGITTGENRTRILFPLNC